MSSQVLVRHSHNRSAYALFDVRPAAAFDGLRGEGARLGLAWFTDAPQPFDGRKSQQNLDSLPFNSITLNAFGDLSRKPAFMRYRARQVSPTQIPPMGGGLASYGLGDTHASSATSATLGKAGLWTGIRAIVERNQHRVLISSRYGRTRAA
jgi:hypothetical protein